MEPTSETETGIHLRPLPKVGQEVGRFLIERELPRGGQARVYRAWQMDLQRAVAIKLLPASYATDPEAITRFRREIENVAKISHPNVVHVYEAGELDGHAFFTMDFIEGNDAESLVKKGPMGPDEAAALIEAVARGVEEAHRSNIVHRDIKPGNIILRKDGTPVLTDFGLAQDLRHSQQLTQTGVSMGTPAYMAPEQARGERQRVGKRSDVYALGATLFTLLTGKRPAEGDSAYEIMVKVAESTGPAWPRGASDDIPRDLRAIVERAMQNDTGKRYESAAELADDLERFLQGEWVVARSRSWASRFYARGRRYIPAAAVIILAAGIAAGMVYSGLYVPEGGGAEGLRLDEKFFDFTKTAPAEIENLFGPTGNWTRSGAAVQLTPAFEMMLTREGDGPIFLSHKDSACWGDFTLRAQILPVGQDGPVRVIVGMTPLADPGDAAYSVSLGDGARQQYVLHRLGVPVLSGMRPDGQPLLASGRWYEAAVTRRAQTVSFVLTDVVAGAPVLAFEFEDEFPAFASAMHEGEALGRLKFGLSAEAAQLGVRNVSVSHTEYEYLIAESHFSVAAFDQVEPRLVASLAQPLPAAAPPEARNERARLLLLRARCREVMGNPEGALADAALARAIAEGADLRGFAALLAARVETAAGDDAAALEHLRNVPLGAFAGAQSRVFHQVFRTAESLRERDPARALLYYEHVANNGLGTPALVSAALLASARIRLAAEPASHAQARAELRRVAGASYQPFPAVQVPALQTLLDLRWRELTGGAEPAPGEPQAAAEIRQLAGQLVASVDAYDTDRAGLVAPLARAAWLERVLSSPLDVAPLQRAASSLQAARRASTKPGEDLWVDLQLALMLEERPQRPDTRQAAWQELARAVNSADATHDGIGTICDFFLYRPLDDADAQRKADRLRNNLKRELASTATHWLGDAGVERFNDYLVALYQSTRKREAATALLEKAATGESGILRLLSGKAETWLPAGS